MNYSKIMAVFAVALACAVSGCKYSQPRNGTGANGGAGDGVTDIETQEGSLDDISEKSFADMYEKCTDVSFGAVYFAFDSAVVPQGEINKIEAVAQHLKDKPNRVVIIEGHCDERGSAAYNLSLGEKRAIIVRNCLVENDIGADRIQTRSFGAEQPAVDGHDESAWAKNRRAEFAIYDTSAKK